MKSLNYKAIVILIIISTVFFFIYFKFLKIEQLDESLSLDVKEEIFTSSNIIEEIKYSSKDLKGNEYIILAKQGEIDLNNNEVIFLKDVIAYIKMIKNKETITIVSDFGKYNTINFDTIFSKNVKINYLDNKIIGDYLDFSMLKNILIVSKNVVYTNPENILKADVIEVDTITKDTKIFMHNSKEKVNVESIN